MARSNDLPRYNDGTRMNHWAIVLLFFAAGLSGLAFFHPSFYFFVNLFGGGNWTRILHPFFGVLMALCFLLMFFRVWKDNTLNKVDREWLAKSNEMLKGNKDAMPPVGKYNAGQKLVFWLMVFSLLILTVTGFAFWQPWFANSFPIGVRRAAVLLHALSAVVLILSVIVHVYASIWVKGTMRAMTRGTVSDAWARKNHPLWHQEVSQKR